MATLTRGACPHDGVRSGWPHRWVRTRPRDLPVAGRRTCVTWTERRWRCVDERCRRKTFTEALPSIPPRSRSTSRPRTSVGEAVADRGRTAVRATRGLEVPWPVANTAFTAAAEAALPKDAPPVTHGRAGDGASLKRQHPSSMGTACRGRRRRPAAAWLSSLRHRRRWRRRAARTAWW
ncbi:transposase family protein [Streptomyces sp. NPDC087270]|uniref:transposase family protein n=1 Tax=Streptomyces sp. NPDC087270 TaxID=3365774 RepID=UPI00381F295F